MLNPQLVNNWGFFYDFLLLDIKVIIDKNSNRLFL